MKVLSTLYRESGLKTLLHADTNTHLIILTRTLRMFAYGFTALILALFFESLQFTDPSIGLFYTLTLLGDVLLSLALTLVADSLGRRRILLAGSCLMIMSGVVFALSESYALLLVAAVLGVLSPSGNEIGPFRAVEESMLAHLSPVEERTEVMSWYVVLPAVGTSTGLIACGNFVSSLKNRSWDEKAAYHACFWIYALCGLLNGGLALIMTSRCEKSSLKEPASSGRASEKRTKKSTFSQISPQSRPTLIKLLLLMSLDSLSSGMAAYSLINLYLTRKFSLSSSLLGNTMSSVWAVSAFMNIWSAAIAKRIGLVKAMVFTHLPSAIFLAIMPASQVWWLTVVLLVARAALNSMDQAPRTAFISAIVKPDERTAVLGIVNVGKILSQSGGPSVTGVLADRGLYWLAFTIAGGLKVSYDLGLLWMWGRGEAGEQGDTGGTYAAAAQDDEDLHGLLSEDDDVEVNDEEQKRAGGYPLQDIR